MKLLLLLFAARCCSKSLPQSPTTRAQLLRCWLGAVGLFGGASDKHGELRMHGIAGVCMGVRVGV